MTENVPLVRVIVRRHGLAGVSRKIPAPNKLTSHGISNRFAHHDTLSEESKACRFGLEQIRS